VGRCGRRPLRRCQAHGICIHWYSRSVSDTTIKISEEIRDRLRTLAEERGLSTRAYVERVVAATPTEVERAERTARGIAYVRANLSADFTDGDVRQAQEWRAAIAARGIGNRR